MTRSYNCAFVTEKINVNDFVGLKGWKAIGNKILKHKNMSGFKFIESEVKEKDSETETLTLF